MLDGVPIRGSTNGPFVAFVIELAWQFTGTQPQDTVLSRFWAFSYHGRCKEIGGHPVLRFFSHKVLDGPSNMSIDDDLDPRFFEYLSNHC